MPPPRPRAGNVEQALRADEGALDRGERPPGLLDDLLHAELFDAPEDQDHPLFDGELGDQAVDRRELGGDVGRRGGRDERLDVHRLTAQEPEA
ncbi:hypothetical protein A7982_12003 [Minicystis rosea]|nr:hypothetical protein A7982_12003 [Minicystis rosea]